MSYIYCITNLINNKKYIGKTTSSLEERFREHCSDSHKERCNKRPLYNAMVKYGIDNFKIDLVEEVTNDSILSEREIFWIKELNTYGNNGYNATKGGDGIIRYDYQQILDLYNLGYSTTEISKKIGCHISTVLIILKSKGIRSRRNSKKVYQYTLQGEYIQAFDSAVLAAEWLRLYGYTSSLKASGHILEVCKGKRYSMYNYIWKFKNI